MRSTSKTMSRRTLLKSAVLIGGGLGTAAVIGCSSATTPQQSSTTATSGTEAAAAQPQVEAITLRYHARASDAEGPLYKKKIPDFNAANPNIKAVIEAIPGTDTEYVPKIMALQAAGNLGDGLWTSIGSVNHYQYANMGITQPLDDLVASSKLDANQYYKGSWEASKYKGKLYGLPLLAHPGAAMVVYNKTLFDKAGVPVPKDDWKIDDLLTLAKQFTQDTNGDGKIDQWGFYPFTGRLIVMLCRTFGGDMINAEGTKATVNDSKTKDALRWVYDVFQTSKVSPTAEALDSGFDQLFLAGKIALYQTGCWGGPGLSNTMRAKKDTSIEWWVTNLPYGPANVIGSHAEVDCVCVSTASKHKEEAFKLISTFVDKEAGVLLGLNFGCAGARPDQYDDDRLRGTYFSKNDAELFKIYNRINAEAGPFYYPANLRGQEAFQIYDQGLASLWLGKAQPTDAYFDDINKQLQAVLDKPIAGA